MSRQVKIKICGIGNEESLQTVLPLGADAVGFIFYDGSPRGVAGVQVKSWIEDLEPFITAVGIFVNDKAQRINSVVKECGLKAVQLHGQETPEMASESTGCSVIKAFRVDEHFSPDKVEPYIPYISAVLLDSKESGVQFDWDKAIEVRDRFPDLPLILAGGLTPENVSGAISKIQPYAVDVSSSLEHEPGVKDPEKVKAFINAVMNTNSSIL